jgi:hypothetical protein
LAISWPESGEVGWWHDINKAAPKMNDRRKGYAFFITATCFRNGNVKNSFLSEDSVI